MRFVESYTRSPFRIESYRCENGPEYRTHNQQEVLTYAVINFDLLVERSKEIDEVYPDLVEVVGPGSMPRGYSIAAFALMSIRRNALVAYPLHHFNFIEKSATAIWRVWNETCAQGCSAPELEITGFFTATFWPNRDVQERTEGRFEEPVTGELRSLRAMASEETKQKFQKSLGFEYRDHIRNAHLLPAIQIRPFKASIPGKTGSKIQRYRPTPKGHNFLSLLEELR